VKNLKDIYITLIRRIFHLKLYILIILEWQKKKRYILFIP